MPKGHCNTEDYAHDTGIGEHIWCGDHDPVEEEKATFTISSETTFEGLTIGDVTDDIKHSAINAIAAILGGGAEVSGYFEASEGRRLNEDGVEAGDAVFVWEAEFGSAE